MREARMKVVGEGWVVHVLGRTALPGYVFGPQEKEAFRKLLWKVSDVCGIGVLTYCLMGNHDHLLLDGPAPHEVPDAELLRRVEVLYGKVAALLRASASPREPPIFVLRRTTRTRGPRPMRGASSLGALRVLRALRIDPIR